MAGTFGLNPPIMEKDSEQLADEQDFRQMFEDLIKVDSQMEEVADDSGIKADREKKAYEYSKYIYNIGSKLQGKFFNVKAHRAEYEDRWTKSLRQYRGEYDPEVIANLPPNRSSSFVRITYNKVRTLDSRVFDLLFPGTGDKNWGITPTPIPTLSPEERQKLAYDAAQQLQRMPSGAEVDEIAREFAKTKCQEMEKVIEDQLADIRYRDLVRNVIHSGNLYGTGVFKGPLVKDVTRRTWKKNPATSMWEQQEEAEVKPIAEFVSLWDFYPDLSVTELENCRFVFQRHIYGKDKLYNLADREDFNGEAIKAYITAHPQGDASYEGFENEVRTISSSYAVMPSRDERYEVVEYWGFVDVEDVKDIPTFEIPEDYDLSEIAVNIWLLNNVVIKAVASPVEDTTFPYFVYYFTKDESSIFGEGIADILRDPQELANAAIRVMMDNAAIAAGPLIEANLDLLPENEDATDIYPFRVIQRTGTGQEAQSRAITVNTLPSYTAEFMNMYELFLKIADDVSTIPRYMYGDSSGISGASRTSSGLSMLMSAANITLKEQIKNYDEGITKPFISALYRYNMLFNPREEIKGDYSVVATGTTSLIAKEVRSESLLRFMSLTQNPVDAGLTNRSQVLREIAKVLDLDEDSLVKTEEQLQIEQQQAAQQQEMMRQQQMEFELNKAMAGAVAGGHSSNVA